MELTPRALNAFAEKLPSLDAARRRDMLSAIHGICPEYSKKHYWFYLWYTNRGLWIPGRFHLFLCNAVQDFLERDTELAYEILVIEAPPQHGKSMTVTEAAPSWCVGKWPDRKIILASYNDETALRFTKANKDKLREFGGELFGVEIGKTADRADEFEIAGYAGRFVSRGLGSGITGHGAHFLFIDDPMKSSEQADSETLRERQWTEWNMTLKTRLAAHAKVIVIATRWHEDDLPGRILRCEPKETVTHIRIPCEAEKEDLLGRIEGEALCPELGKGSDWLAQYKKGFQTQSGLRAWNTLFQGRPTSLEGNLLKRHWWKQYRREQLPPMVQTLISVDAAFKGGETNDFVSIQLWGKRNADIYLIDRDKRRLDFPSTLAAIRGMVQRHRFSGIVLIEDKANGSAIIQTLGREIPGIVAVNPEGGKLARVNAVSPAIESGNVWLPHPGDAPWVEEFIEECAQFPYGKHDDDVDAMSQALNRLIRFEAGSLETEGAREEGIGSFITYGI
jgi:predicted phage terminase large subunit-like protein